MINVKMPNPSVSTLSDVIHLWVKGEEPEEQEPQYETDPRVALLRVLIHRSVLDFDEVRELFFAVYPFESEQLYQNIVEYELG